MIDDVDRRILKNLQLNARMTNVELSRRVGMAPSAVLERVKKLEARGVIESYEAKVDPHVLDLGLLAFVFVRADEPPGRLTAGEALAKVANVQEVHHVAGEDCYLVKVRAKDPEDLGRLLRKEIGAIPSVTSTRTTIVLETVHECDRLPSLERSEADPQEVA